MRKYLSKITKSPIANGVESDTTNMKPHLSTPMREDAVLTAFMSYVRFLIK